MPPAPAEAQTKTLTASKIEATSARITIAGHTTAWYYKKTSPTPAGSCTGPVASGTAFKDLTGLTANTSYTYEAFSDSTCTTGNKLATATFTTTPAATLAAADAGKKVRVKVSFTDDGNSAHTLESINSGVIAAAHATAPEPVAAVNVTHQGSSLEVSWNAPACATHYDVTYSSGGNARAAWNRAGTSITIRRDSREGYENQNCVSGGTAYTVGVRARNAVGASAWVDSAQVSSRRPIRWQKCVPSTGAPPWR